MSRESGDTPVTVFVAPKIVPLLATVKKCSCGLSIAAGTGADAA